MTKNGCYLVLILISMTLIATSSSDDTKLQDVLRKSTTNSNNRNYNNTEDDVLKVEAMKVIRRCQTDGSDNKKNDTGYDNGYSKNYNGYNNAGNAGESGYRNYRDSSNYDYSYDNNNRNNRNHNGDRSSSSYPTNSKNCTENRSVGGSDSNDDNYRKNQDSYYNTYRGEGNNGNYGSERTYFSSRIRREDRRNNNDQCVSQCVFGYMNLVDENQVPSETLTIKWLQDHMANNDLKRIRALRAVRRCFAKLTTSDIEDGCEFSKELSNCMNLDIE